MDDFESIEDEIPDNLPVGTKVEKCQCGEVRYQVPGNTLDIWKDHFDYGPDEGGCPLDNRDN